MSESNPYNFNLPVSPALFFGRQQDVDVITDDLLSMPGDSYAIIGGRRMGKTSILEAICRKIDLLSENTNNSAITIPILIDLDCQGCESSIVDIFQLILESFSIQMEGYFGIHAHHIKISQQEISPARVMENFLIGLNKNIIQKYGKRLRFILLLDECEQVVEHVWVPDFYSSFRYVLNNRLTRPLLKLVLAGSHRFLTQVRQHGSPLRNILKYHSLSVFDQQSTYSLITNPTGYILPLEIIHKISEKSGGHPFLTQFIMHKIWALGIESVDLDRIDQIANTFFIQRHDFQDWVDDLGSETLRMYRTISQFNNPIKAQDIRKLFHPMPDDFIQMLNALCYHGLLIQLPDFSYTVTSTMFYDWFKMNYSEECNNSINTLKADQNRAQPVNPQIINVMPGANLTQIDQRNQNIQGPQTNVGRDTEGPTLSGNFQDEVKVDLPSKISGEKNHE